MTDVLPRSTDPAIEIWQDVPFPDFAAYYQVSNLGRVRRKNPTGNNKPHGLLRPKTLHCGHLAVCLYGADRKKMFTVHSLVAAAFIGSRPLRMVINHIDFDMTNNRRDNLEYTTQRGNIHHSHKHGRIAQGFRLPQTKLSDEQVREIRQLAATKTLSQSQIAAMYDIHQKTVSEIHLRQKRYGVKEKAR